MAGAPTTRCCSARSRGRKGIPTVWVKSMDEDFIREFVERDGRVRSWRGHVYLRVWDGQWKLYDAVQDRLYEEPFDRALPGGRWAYDVGDDPHAMVLSTQWDRWKRQTRRYLADFDTSRLRPEAEPTYIAADSPYWRILAEHLYAQGVPVRESFNTDWDAELLRAAGHRLVIVAVGEDLVLPEDRWPLLTGQSVGDFRASLAGKTAMRIDHLATDATSVTVLWAADGDGARAMIDALPD
jgi:hypothetical protein